ncbi:hypothetical protein [Paenibacillus sp. N3.4]|uniref:hypothetical protein n=1 Tax=Paenibacillus sp. N3.4 TaxID=2603222 RepID=UPI0011CBEF71|nr:hypothetical protein [Paenibacillus sp. N3.4]TXK77124.1 hypothetical protein FU659_23650 [Paenibacillus sp. N3.4]
MARYWLTPIIDTTPFTLGAERIECAPLSELEAFRELAHKSHPRLLPMFKSNLLLSDDEDVCGSELAELDLLDEKAIVFNGNPYYLSHCAEAFLDRLLKPQQASEFVSSMDLSEFTPQANAQAWRKQWHHWLKSGYDVILLREDGR